MLACLQIERESKAPKKAGRGQGIDRVNYASEEAREHWSHAFRS